MSSEARDAALQLTPEQAARLDELHKELREKRTASIRQRGGRDGIRTNNRELMSEYRESLESVLDARQLEVFQIHAALMGMARDHTFARSRGPHRKRNSGR